MIDVCTRYEEHLSIGSRITRDVIAEQRRTDLIYQRCVPRSKSFPPAYCHYTRIIGNKQQEHDSWCNLSKTCNSKANPKPSRDLLSIKASSTRIMIDQSHKRIRQLQLKISLQPHEQTRTLPHEAKRRSRWRNLRQGIDPLLSSNLQWRWETMRPPVSPFSCV